MQSVQKPPSSDKVEMQISQIYSSRIQISLATSVAFLPDKWLKRQTTAPTPVIQQSLHTFTTLAVKTETGNKINCQCNDSISNLEMAKFEFFWKWYNSCVSNILRWRLGQQWEKNWKQVIIMIGNMIISWMSLQALRRNYIENRHQSIVTSGIGQENICLRTQFTTESKHERWSLHKNIHQIQKHLNYLI